MTESSNRRLFVMLNVVKQDIYGKRRLFQTLSWIIIAVYVALNIFIFLTNTPFSVLIVVLPIINIALIISWFFVRTIYNNANNKIKHALYLEHRPSEKPVSKYGNVNREDYVPHLQIKTDLLQSINTTKGNKTMFDVTMRDYLKPGRAIVFHDELNYGTLKQVQVMQAHELNDGIEAAFTDVTRSN